MLFSSCRSFGCKPANKHPKLTLHTNKYLFS
uniref:Uncharacterized protein n=1 Tax=Setaria viridis TaxID=4556 RepID=A0A4U6UGF8_SETVI|nr:hypothetical protein SEVIR_6G109450v2 [Setaria viridis]